MKKIRARIEEKVMDSSGTWIDWQYLLDSAMLLKKVGHVKVAMYLYYKVVCVCLYVYLFPHISVSFTCMRLKFTSVQGPWRWFVHQK